jgi:hypothetical protein
VNQSGKRYYPQLYIRYGFPTDADPVLL